MLRSVARPRRYAAECVLWESRLVPGGTYDPRDATKAPPDAIKNTIVVDGRLPCVLDGFTRRAESCSISATTQVSRSLL